MQKRYLWMAAGAGVLMAGAGVALASGQVATKAAPAATPWIHVRVEEPRNDTRVNVNLPLGVVQAALQAAPDKVMSHGHVHVGTHGDHDLSVADMRKMWAELKKAPDGDMVTDDQKDEHVRVARRGDLVEVRSEKGNGEKVRVDVPVTVVDALLRGEGDELDVAAAVSELQKLRGDIVTVHDEKDTTVHIWIDTDSASAHEGGK